MDEHDVPRVEGTPVETRLRQLLLRGDRVRVGHPQLLAVRGIDHCFCPDGEGFRQAARLAPDLVLLDLSMRQGGLWALDRIARECFDCVACERLVDWRRAAAADPAYTFIPPRISNTTQQ